MLGILAILLGMSHAQALSAKVSIPESYAEVNPGGKIYIETEIKWPENDYRKDLHIEYSVKDESGDEVAYLNTLKAVETQASFMESIAIPESAQAGTYRVDVTITDYADLNQAVSASFNVAEKGRDMFNTYLIIILGVVVFVAVLLTANLLVLTNMRRKAAASAKRR